MTSPARRRALAAYIRRCATILRLQAWDIDVRGPADDPKAILTIEPHEPRHNAIVRIGSFFDEPKVEQRYTVGHELVHLAQAHVWELVDLTVADWPLWALAMQRDVAMAHAETLRRECELQADVIGRWIAPLLPMPPRWPR